jgi:hypothetical protein
VSVWGMGLIQMQPLEESMSTPQGTQGPGLGFSNSSLGFGGLQSYARIWSFGFGG